MRALAVVAVLSLTACENIVAGAKRQKADKSAWIRVGGSTLTRMDDSARGVSCYAIYLHVGKTLSCVKTFDAVPPTFEVRP